MADSRSSLASLCVSVCARSAGGKGYFQTMLNEFNLRDTSCYVNSLRERIAPMVFSILSLL